MTLYLEESTYAFLNQQTIFEEQHVWCDVILAVVQQSNHAIWVHRLSCEELQGDKDDMSEDDRQNCAASGFTETLLKITDHKLRGAVKKMTRADIGCFTIWVCAQI